MGQSPFKSQDCPRGLADKQSTLDRLTVACYITSMTNTQQVLSAAQYNKLHKGFVSTAKAQGASDTNAANYANGMMRDLNYSK